MIVQERKEYEQLNEVTESDYVAVLEELGQRSMNSETSNTAVNARKVQIDRMSTVGTEALYGAKPSPDTEGVYPYVYNMAAVAGMRVRENGETYVCTRDIDPLLYPPSQVTAHFNKEE